LSRRVHYRDSSPEIEHQLEEQQNKPPQETGTSQSGSEEGTYDDFPQPLREVQYEKENEIYVVVEEQPHYPGGEDALKDFIQAEIRYPAEARELGVSGRVFVTFVVEKNGEITGIPVRMQFNLPMKFTLQ